MNGWECPRCGCVWAPHVAGCERCNGSPSAKAPVGPRGPDVVDGGARKNVVVRKTLPTERANEVLKRELERMKEKAE